MKQLLKGFAVVAILAIAGFLLHRTLARYSLAEITRSVARIPFEHLAAAFGFACLSYLSLTGFDWLALRHVRHPLAWPRAALASFCALSIGHNVGFAALSSGAIRYRFYARWGLKAAEIAQIIVFCGLTVGLGLMTLGGLALLLRTELAAQMTRLPPAIAMALGAGLLCLAGAYIVLAATLRRPLIVRRHRLRMPDLRLALAQIGIGTVNFACVAACLQQTLAAFDDVAYLSVAAAYVLANTAGIISHVPGGLGVIESVLALLLSQADLIGALVAFRVVYYLVPLCFGAVAFLLSELLIKHQKRGGRRSGARDPEAR